MTNKEILNKAIEKAFGNSWEFDNLDKWEVTAGKVHQTVMNNWYQYIFVYKDQVRVIDIERIIYDHSFAKALWPDPENYNVSIPSWGKPTPYWQTRLKEMVIADDPIKYLGENI